MQQKVVLILLITFISTFYTLAQKAPQPHVKPAVTLVSKHIWRGMVNGTAPSFQPSVEYINGHFIAGAWAAMALNSSYHELDLYVSYQLKTFTFSLYDYYCPKRIDPADFFVIEQGITKHTFDLTLSYADAEHHPLELLVSTFLFGDDQNPVTKKNYYSTYIEPAIAFKLKHAQCKAFTGFAPYKSYYAHQFSFINIGISAKQMLEISPRYSAQARFAAVYNPLQKSFNLAIGFQF